MYMKCDKMTEGLIGFKQGTEGSGFLMSATSQSKTNLLTISRTFRNQENHWGVGGLEMQVSMGQNISYWKCFLQCAFQVSKRTHMLWGIDQRNFFLNVHQSKKTRILTREMWIISNMDQKKQERYSTIL